MRCVVCCRSLAHVGLFSETRTHHLKSGLNYTTLHCIALSRIDTYMHTYVAINQITWFHIYIHTCIAYITPCEPPTQHCDATITLRNAQHNAIHHATQRSATQRAPMQRNARQRDTRDATQRTADYDFVSSLARATEHALQSAACARTREPEYSLASCCKASLDF